MVCYVGVFLLGGGDLVQCFHEVLHGVEDLSLLWIVGGNGAAGVV